MSINADEGDRRLMQKIAQVFDEVRASHATHNRKLKDLSGLRSSSSLRFFHAFSRTLTPLFNFRRRSASAERIVHFVSLFASNRDAKDAATCDAFLEEFLRFLLVAAGASNKAARFRACQIISEIIMQLPDDTEVSSDLWDEALECMKLRVRDKVPIVRTFAVRALSRFANDCENSDILELLLRALSLEQNADVRKTIVLSLPPSNSTSGPIINCTLDNSESVRKAAYCVLANKFPLQSLSIKLRALILQRGLTDRSPNVNKECLKLLKDEWFEKCCNGDPIELLKFLDVETYELVGESVMYALLKAGLVKVKTNQSIRQFILLFNDGDKGCCTPSIQLMEAEVALSWKTICKHFQSEAQEKGVDAAMKMGIEATVYAAEAFDSNDLLERFLPASVADYVELVRAHITAGPNYHFSSRQLLLLGEMLDYSDATNRKVASEFVLELLHKPIDHEVDENGHEVVIGDGINLGGDKDWAEAISRLARKVHAAFGEFEEVVSGVINELAHPCRERTADSMQWLHCLAVISLLLENAKSLHLMQGKTIQHVEILHSLLLPGAKHAQMDVQRAAVRSLGLYGLLEGKPTEQLIRQLRLSFIRGPSSISMMACKALLDLGMWHGPQEVDKALNVELSSPLQDQSIPFQVVKQLDTDKDVNITLVDLLYFGLDTERWGRSLEVDDIVSVKASIGEGFAKFLLLSEKYEGISSSTQCLLLTKLICLYFGHETKGLQRLKQCLSVFFEHYSSLSVNHRKCLSKVFIPVMRSMWPGINGKPTGSPVMVSNMRKRTVQASRFMLQMIQTPLYTKGTSKLNGTASENSDGVVEPLLDFESGEEGLALRIAIEVASFHAKKTAAEKSYVVALSRVLVLLQFRISEQGPIKLMRRLLKSVIASASFEKEIVKELRHMDERLKAIDETPDQQIFTDDANFILGSLGLEFNIDADEPMEVQPTPAPRSTRPRQNRRRTRKEEVSSSDDEISPTSVVPMNPVVSSTRSQRASKTAAMSKIAANNTTIEFSEFEEDEDEENGSEVTSEDDSEEFDGNLNRD